ncbi:DUF3343 domain-containing protein [Veillonella magna]|uniref:DUF3343 domain-containing protein n=1 Tax=Veillonella magna TaxID=464322 RepID=UPI0025861B0B|nr:DUF3343 domain-containing protein [Veillonella magna]
MDTLIMFTSYYFATKAETLFKEKGLVMKLIPTPPQLHHACGLCILLKRVDLGMALGYMRDNGISHSGVYSYGGSAKDCVKLSADELFGASLRG